jgi:hypothetical protein
MTTTVVPYNATTPNGRAITHILTKSALADVGDGLEVKEHTGGGRSLIVRPPLADHPSAGEATLLLIVESFAGQSPVVLGFALEDIDQRSQRAVAEAVLIASGLRGAVAIEVPGPTIWSATQSAVSRDDRDDRLRRRRLASPLRHGAQGRRMPRPRHP